ncbi:MAG TPA: superoxide dismutase, Ni [Candidatus Limnocylindrales bacterium]
MSQVIRRLGRLLAPTTVVHAHCDVPCGIYDPAGAQLAAKTVTKMVELIGAIEAGSTAVADRNKFIRCVTVKEQHAELVKHEVQVIWSDYFKPEHLAANPDLHTKVWNILKLAGKNKQSVDAEAAAQLEASVKEFADIFWATKK